MKAYKPYRNFVLGMGAMIFMTLAIAAHANQIGVVDFANGSTRPTHVSRYLLDQAKVSTSKPGQVVLLRAGASPVGGAAFNFVLSGERAAAVRNALVGAGIPRKKIVSQFVGIVNRGSAAQDREVIVDATTREALANGGKSVAVPQATPKQIRKLQSEIWALQAAQAHKPKAATKPARVRNWTGGAFYLSRTASVNSTTTTPSFYGPGSYQQGSYGDTYDMSGYGFSLNRRPFYIWGLPMNFGIRGVSQQAQIVNPVLQGTSVVSFAGNGYLIRSLQARDSVATQYIQTDASTQTDVFGVTVSPGVRVGWMGAQSVSGGETTTPPPSGCAPPFSFGAVSYVNLTSTNGSSVRVTPSLKIGYGPVSLSYSQSPWGASGYNAPRVIMASGHWGRFLQVKGGVALPDCPSICQGGSAITEGKIVSLTMKKWGWGINLTDVMGEKFTQGGATVPGTLAQIMAPYNPARPWDSYNPGVTLTLTKSLTRHVQASVSYGYESESGLGNSAQTSGLDGVQTSAVIKTTEISLKGRF
ncbi:MAG: OmpA family protein [Acidiferrobacter sp.]